MTEEGEEGQEARSPRTWSPERVDAGLESNLVRAAHLLRRAHWLCQLSEASLAWRPRNVECGLRCLVVVGGRVARVDDLPDRFSKFRFRLCSIRSLPEY